MSQKRNNTDGFSAGTDVCLDILGSYVVTKEVCTVSWHSSEGGLYERTSILRDIYQKDGDYIVALESGPQILLKQFLGIKPGTLPHSSRLEDQPGKTTIVLHFSGE